MLIYITLIIIFMSVALASSSEPAQAADIAPMITKEALKEILAIEKKVI